jgi:hypothetical protein
MARCEHGVSDYGDACSRCYPDLHAVPDSLERRARAFLKAGRLVLETGEDLARSVVSSKSTTVSRDK